MTRYKSPDLTKLNGVLLLNTTLMMTHDGSVTLRARPLNDNKIFVAGTRNLAPIMSGCVAFQLLGQGYLCCQLQIDCSVQFIFNLDNTHDFVCRHELADILSKFLFDYEVLHFN